MNELIEKVEKLKECLELNEHVIRIKELNKKVEDDKDLLSLIEEYRKTYSEEVKSKIISNQLYRDYLKEENEINFIILGIRQELKTINKESKCGR